MPPQVNYQAPVVNAPGGIGIGPFVINQPAPSSQSPRRIFWHFYPCEDFQIHSFYETVIEKIGNPDDFSKSQLSTLYILGPSGSGKSQLAYYYGKTYCDTIDENINKIAWLFNAKTIEDLCHSYLLFARSLGITTSAYKMNHESDSPIDENGYERKLTRIRLEVDTALKDKTCLFIFDDVRDHNLVKNYLNFAPNIKKKIILTAREKPKSIPKLYIELHGGLDIQDGIKFLQELSKIESFVMEESLAKSLLEKLKFPNRLAIMAKKIKNAINVGRLEPNNAIKIEKFARKKLIKILNGKLLEGLSQEQKNFLIFIAILKSGFISRSLLKIAFSDYKHELTRLSNLGYILIAKREKDDTLYKIHDSISEDALASFYKRSSEEKSTLIHKISDALTCFAEKSASSLKTFRPLNSVLKSYWLSFHYERFFQQEYLNILEGEGKSNITLAKLYINAGNVYLETRENLQQAINFFEQALTRTTFIRDDLKKAELKIEVFNRLGMIYRECGQYERAKSYLEDALKMASEFEKLNNSINSDLVGNVYHSLVVLELLSNYFCKEKDFNPIIQYSIEALNRKKTNDGKYMISAGVILACQMIGKIGKFLQEGGELEAQAEFNVLQSEILSLIDCFVSRGHKKGTDIARIYFAIAVANNLLGKYDDALECLKESSAIAKETTEPVFGTHNMHRQALALLEYWQAYLGKNDLPKANGFFEKAAELLRKTRESDSIEIRFINAGGYPYQKLFSSTTNQSRTAMSFNNRDKKELCDYQNYIRELNG